MKANRIALWMTWFGALALAYAGFENTLPPSELGAACIAALIGTAILIAFTYLAPQQVAARWDWLPIYVRRLPGAMLLEAWYLLGPMLWNAVRRKNVRGRFIALPFDAGGDDGASASRRIAVIYGSSITPNAIPVFIDRESGLLVLHQLKHRREPGAGDREWPI